MSSLPILSSQTPNSGKIDAAKTGNAPANAEDIANGAAPFGELLAKQLNTQGSDIKRDLLKALTSVEGDVAVAEANPLEVRTDGIALPTDLLASLQAKDSKLQLAGKADIAPQLDEKPTKAGVRVKADVSATDSTREETTAALGKGQQVEQADARTAKPAAATDARFAAILANEKQGAHTTTTAKTDLPIQPANTAAPAVPAAVTGITTTPNGVTQVTVATPVHQPQWTEDFAQKVTWVATQRNQSAELHLNPAQLGPLEISLKLNGDHATLQFNSAHAAVREAIEQSIPRLRDMMAESGIALGNATVSDQAPREQQQRSQASNDSTRSSDSPDRDSLSAADSAQTQSTVRVSRHDGMVDTFV